MQSPPPASVVLFVAVGAFAENLTLLPAAAPVAASGVDSVVCAGVGAGAGAKVNLEVLGVAAAWGPAAATALFPPCAPAAIASAAEPPLVGTLRDGDAGWDGGGASEEGTVPPKESSAPGFEANPVSCSARAEPPLAGDGAAGVDFVAKESAGCVGFIVWPDSTLVVGDFFPIGNELPNCGNLLDGVFPKPVVVPPPPNTNPPEGAADTPDENTAEEGSVPETPEREFDRRRPEATPAVAVFCTTFVLGPPRPPAGPAGKAEVAFRSAAAPFPLSDCCGGATGATS